MLYNYYKEMQQVQVYIAADNWVIGIIVGFVHLTSKITGSKYKVEFRSDESGRPRHGTGVFFHEQLRPYGPGG